MSSFSPPSFDEITRAIVPTTKAQVSGHKFLRRRVEHGLVLGDIRMIHDPLSARQRAFTFGVVAAVLVGLGAGLLAWLNPNADPGDAPVLRDSRHDLYVQIDGTLHPVPNLTSARLITGNPVEATTIGDDHLADTPRGVPVGIVGAPGEIADQTPAAWLVCTDPDTKEVTVLASEVEVESVGKHQALLARTPPTDGTNTDWLLNHEGRRALPAEETPFGRVVRRQLGITPDTAHIELAPEVLSVLPELTPWQVAPELGEVVQVEEEFWLLADASVQPLTPVQANILLDLGASSAAWSREELAHLPDADSGAVALPEQRPERLSTADRFSTADICVGERGLVLRSSLPGAVTLAGEAIADFYASDIPGAIGIDSGAGLVLVAPTGQWHAIDEPGWQALGLAEPVPAPWSVVRLLPQGPDLTREAALAATY